MLLSKFCLFYTLGLCAELSSSPHNKLFLIKNYLLPSQDMPVLLNVWHFSGERKQQCTRTETKSRGTLGEEVFALLCAEVVQTDRGHLPARPLCGGKCYGLSPGTWADRQLETQVLRDGRWEGSLFGATDTVRLGET